MATNDLRQKSSTYAEEVSSIEGGTLVYLDLPLPNFSQYVKAKLAARQSHLVWKKLVGESAYHYLGIFPQIGKVNSSIDYREIGSKIYQTYPAIARDGTHPWTLFTKCLSQKIRRIRWDNNRRTAATGDVTSVSTNDVRSEAKSGVKSVSTRDVTQQIPCSQRFSVVGIQAPVEDCDEQTYDSHVLEMAQEMKKTEPNTQRIEALMKATFPGRRKWIRQLPAGSVRSIFEKFPCFRQPSYLLNELRCLLNVPSLEGVMDRLKAVLKAVSRLKKVVHDECCPGVLKALETETAYRHGKGQKTKSIVEIVQHKGEPLEQLLSSAPNSVPTLVAIQNHEQFVNAAIVCDATYILLDTANIAEATAALMAMYYLTDTEYPKIYSQVLGFLQQTVFMQQYEGHKTHGFIQFLRRITAAIET